MAENDNEDIFRPEDTCGGPGICKLCSAETLLAELGFEISSDIPVGIEEGGTQMYTSHGHHIPDTAKGTKKPRTVKKCGGVLWCQNCKEEIVTVWKDRKPVDNQTRAKQALANYINSHFESGDVPAYEVLLFEYSEILKNWKALLTTDQGDSTHYEITYDGEQKLMYIKTFEQYKSVVIPD